MADKAEVLKVKEECRTTKREAMLGPLKCKQELWRVLDYIDKLHYHDHVDYSYIYKLLEEVIPFIAKYHFYKLVLTYSGCPSRWR
ncbi:unnamed protein product [Strongylus vulgaris]|uniref:Uncharacterized protein n=1 Tax=Strongylus vulgaris TaxID=40348 RepID=A0A3P7JJ72_STRVU|nr:unnamed protein product [Strongylus vulgaris]